MDYPKQFASPGIDSDPSEQGVYNSGAGLSPDATTAKRAPWDWKSVNKFWDRTVGNLIGNFSATKGTSMAATRLLKRGTGPWSGHPSKYASGFIGPSYENPGGNVDMNPGASSLIAGGPGAASSMVRTSGARKTNEGMKLPTLPASTTRGERAQVPAGGAMPGTGAPVPTLSKLGFPSVIKVLMNPATVKGK